MEEGQEKIKIQKMKDILKYRSFLENKIPGGLSHDKTLADIKKKHNLSSEDQSIDTQLEKGISVEMEHTDDRSIAREIAMDHLMEDPNYYDKLEQIENTQESIDNILSYSQFFEKKRSYSGTHGGLDKWFKEKWVDISKTNPDGSHPPCGRDDASKGGYPKCRKVRVAAKMTKKQKRASVSRKRKVEREGKKGPRTPNYSK